MADTSKAKKRKAAKPSDGSVPPTEKKASFHEQVAQRLIEALESGTSPFQKDWEGGMNFMPHNPTTGKPYKGINAFILMMVGAAYSDTRWLTYKQAEKLGAQVKKGEHGTTIEYWKFNDQQPIFDDEGKPELDDDGKQKYITVRLEKPRVFFATVFNAEQCDNLPPPVKIADMSLQWDANERAEFIIAASGADITYKGQDLAFYRPSEDKIFMPLREQFTTAGRFYSTELHELGHWTGHPSRLNRPMVGRHGNIEEYAIEELRAEIASLMIGQVVGVGYSFDNHAAYVDSWIKSLKNDPKEIFRAASDADKIMNFLFELEKKARQEAGLGEAQNDMNDDFLVSGNPDNQETVGERVYLVTHYDERRMLKSLGAEWDETYDGRGAWYVPPGVAIEPFAQWLPATQDAVADDSGMPSMTESGNSSWDAPSFAVKPAINDGQAWNPDALIQKVYQWRVTGFRLVANKIVDALTNGLPDMAIDLLKKSSMEKLIWPEGTDTLLNDIEIEWQKWQVANGLGPSVTPEGKLTFESTFRSNNLVNLLSPEGQQAMQQAIVPESPLIEPVQQVAEPEPSSVPSTETPVSDAGLEQVWQIQAVIRDKKCNTVPVVDQEVQQWLSWANHPEPLTKEGGGDLLQASFDRVVGAIKGLVDRHPAGLVIKPTMEDINAISDGEAGVKRIDDLSRGGLEKLADMANAYAVKPHDQLTEHLCTLVSHTKTAEESEGTASLEDEIHRYGIDKSEKTIPAINEELGKWAKFLDDPPGKTFEGMATLWQSFNRVIAEIEGLRVRNPSIEINPTPEAMASLLVKNAGSDGVFAKPLHEFSDADIHLLARFAAWHSTIMTTREAGVTASYLGAVFEKTKEAQQKDIKSCKNDKTTVIADFGTLMRLASALGKAKQGGNEEDIKQAQDAHDAYANMCLDADSINLGMSYGDMEGGHAPIYEISLAWKKRDGNNGQESAGFDLKGQSTTLRDLGSLLSKYGTVFSGKLEQVPSGKVWYPGEQNNEGSDIIRRSLRLDSVDGHLPTQEDIQKIHSYLSVMPSIQTNKNKKANQIQVDEGDREDEYRMAM